MKLGYDRKADIDYLRFHEKRAVPLRILQLVRRSDIARPRDHLSERSNRGFSRSIGGGISPSSGEFARCQGWPETFHIKNQYFTENPDLARGVHLRIYTSESFWRSPKCR
jgi:hypothetical protein